MPEMRPPRCTTRSTSASHRRRLAPFLSRACTRCSAALPRSATTPNVDGVQVSEGDVATFLGRRDQRRGRRDRHGLLHQRRQRLGRPGARDHLLDGEQHQPGLHRPDLRPPGRAPTRPTPGTLVVRLRSTTLSAITWVFRTGTAGDPERILRRHVRDADVRHDRPGRHVGSGTVFTDTAYIRSVQRVHRPDRRHRDDTTLPTTSTRPSRSTSRTRFKPPPTRRTYLPSVTGSKAVVSSLDHRDEQQRHQPGHQRRDRRVPALHQSSRPGLHRVQRRGDQHAPTTGFYGRVRDHAATPPRTPPSPWTRCRSASTSSTRPPGR